MDIRKIEDPKVWNESAQTFDHATFLDSWNWGEFEREMGFEFHNLGLYEGDSIVGLLPIKVVKAKRGKYLMLRHSPLINWGNKEHVEFVLDFLREMSGGEGVDFVRMSPLLLDTPEGQSKIEGLGLVDASSHTMDAERTIVLDLTKDEETLMKEMRKNTRYSVRQAMKLGVEVEHTDGDEKFDLFYDIFTHSAARNNWGRAYSKEYLKKEYDIFRRDGYSRMFFAKYKGEVIAAAMFNFFNGQVAYHHSGSLSEFRKIPSMYSIIWEAANYGRSVGMKKLNLWGVIDKEDKKHPWYGLSLFKYGFGGDVVKYVHAKDMVVKPFAHVTRGFEMIENRFRGF